MIRNCLVIKFSVRCMVLNDINSKSMTTWVPLLLYVIFMLLNYFIFHSFDSHTISKVFRLCLNLKPWFNRLGKRQEQNIQRMFPGLNSPILKIFNYLCAQIIQSNVNKALGSIV